MDVRDETLRFNPAALPDSYFPKTAKVEEELYPKHYLIPGTVFSSGEPFIVTTILGSGVAISLWDDKAKVGGVNHFTLPEGEQTGNTKIAAEANAELLRQVLQRGVSISSLRAGIFGASQPPVGFSNAGKSIGTRNLEAAEAFLAQHGILVAKRETGGIRGRKLVFNTSDGSTLARQL
jgi:chemotaxis protein CheD